MTQRRLSVIFILLFSFGFIWGGSSPAEAVPPVRIMPLGDSITYDSRGDESRPDDLRTGYRQPLWLLLQSAGYSVDFVGSLVAGQAAIPAFDPDNEGHPGWRADMITPEIYGWLQDHPADIILLHIGTNDLNTNSNDTSAADVQNILDEIDRFEENFGVAITVVLARIINTSNHICPNLSYTTTFNNNVEAMALDRVNNAANAAYPDKIIMVPLECGAGLDYGVDTTAPYAHDMYDFLHPNQSGYDKMAIKWFDSLAAHLGTAGQGSITIVKATQPSGGTGFGFAGDLGGFTLADGQSQTFTGLEARNYRITESVPAGWSLQSAVCSGGDFTPAIDGVTIHLNKAQHITCTFTNSEPIEVPSGTYLEAGSGASLYFSFLGGSLSGTKLDNAIDALVLDNSTMGFYTSQVFDAGVVVDWESIRWVSNVAELPNAGMADPSVDMSGNVLLFHLDRDASYGETNSFVYDFSGRGHHGAASGAGVSIGAVGSGKFRGGYTADNTDDAGHIAVASSSDFNFATTNTDGFSFFTWFAKSGNCQSPDDDNEVIASRFGADHEINTWWLGCSANTYPNRLVLDFLPQSGNQAVIASTTAINDGQWHHGGWVYDPTAGEVRLYLDGELVASELTTPGPFTSANPLCIGAYDNNCDSYEFVGNLDEVVVFKRALTSSEVKKLFTRGVAGLDLQARACDDPACNGESWVEIADESPQSLSLTGRYLQYKFNFSSPDTAHSPELYSVTIHLPSADIDGDGVVDGSDSYLFMLSYGKSSGSAGFDARCDFDGNGTVNATDLATFAAKFGK